MIHSFQACDINAPGLLRSSDNLVGIFATNGMTNGTAQGSACIGSSWATAVVKFKRANTPSGPWYDMTSAVSLTSSSMSTEFDCSGFAWIGAFVDTVEGSTQYADFWVNLNEVNG